MDKIKEMRETLNEARNHSLQLKENGMNLVEKRFSYDENINLLVKVIKS